jgi:UDP:flavonoid glycosyltransferase YjiC (YdhE family)
VGFGTAALFNDVPTLIRAVVATLLELDYEVTVTTGRDDLVSELDSLDPERVHAVRWVDLSKVLQSCSVVVCHGGAGTVLAGLSAGVPLLLLPQGAPSQLRMATACEARGVGRAFAWGGANVSDLHDVILEVASSEAMRSAAAALANEIAAMPPPSTASTVLEAIISRVP